MDFIKSFEHVLDRAIVVFTRPGILLVWISLFLLFLFLKSLGADPDLFARVAAGRLWELGGSVAVLDPFAFTPKRRLWIDHEWLSGVVFYFVSQAGGDLALFMFKWFVAILSFWVLLTASERYQKHSSLLWSILIAYSCSYVWASTVRAQVFTYLFLPLFLLGFIEHRKYNASWPLLMFPLLMIPWANAHGGFVVGLGFLGIYTALSLLSTETRSLALVSSSVLTVLVTLINPYGILYWEYILEAVTMDRPTISEWSPLVVTSSEAFIPLLLLVFFALGAFLRKRWPSLLVVLLVAASVYEGFKHNRLIAVLLMVLLVYGGKELNAVMESFAKSSPSFFQKLKRSSTVCLIAFFILFMLPACKFLGAVQNFSLSYKDYPVQALEWLYENKNSGNVLIDFNRGSYALWRLYPKFRISMDGRYEEVYLNETVTSVSHALDIASSEHLKELEKINPDYVVLSTDSKAGRAWQEFGMGFSPVYSDSEFMILSRESSLQTSLPPTGVADVWLPRW